MAKLLINENCQTKPIDCVRRIACVDASRESAAEETR